MTTTKDLIEQLRIAGDEVFSTRKKSMIADSLERLAQPVGVGPVARVLGCINGHSLIDALLPADDCLYPAETVARLIAERGEALAACARLDQRLTDANHLRFREGLERDALQDQVKTLREALTLGSRYIYGEGSEEEIIEVEKALAATEKEKTE